MGFLSYISRVVLGPRKKDVERVREVLKIVYDPLFGLREYSEINLHACCDPMTGVLPSEEVKEPYLKRELKSGLYQGTHTVFAIYDVKNFYAHKPRVEEEGFLVFGTGKRIPLIGIENTLEGNVDAKTVRTLNKVFNQREYSPIRDLFQELKKAGFNVSALEKRLKVA